ncbi:MAG: ATP-binding protein [Anaerolineales bacterium]
MPTAKFPARFESLEKISQFVVQAARDAGFDESAVYAVELAVDEACSNIIEHAYAGEDEGDIQCSCQIANNDLKIVLRDNGRPFDPDSILEPNFGAPIEELQPRGAGLFLMRKLMDEVKFEFAADSGNVLTMVKHREK